MMSFWSTILSAIILGPLVVMLRGFRKSNAEDHATVRGILHDVNSTISRVEAKIDRVDERIDHHIEYHLEHDSTKEK
jgi:hypothetical protein